MIGVKSLGVIPMIPTELRDVTDAFFAANKNNFNFETVDGCGKYIEALVPYCQSHGYPKVGFLKYTGNGTKYNNHRIDSFLYNDTVTINGMLQSCDVIKDAETNYASAGWSLDQPRYTKNDWAETLEELIGEVGGNNMVPYVPYDEAANQEMKRQLAYDYARRPQNADFDVCIWNARVFHNAYMGPEGKPLGMVDGTSRARSEWCGALGIPVIPVPNDWQIGDPV